MNEELEKMIEKTKQSFPGSFINARNELIFELDNNLYFILDGVHSELDFKCKLFAWLSRPISKGLSDYWSEKILKRTNELLGTNFTKEEMRKIYTYLGNDVNRALCIEFIESDYDFSVLK